MRRGSDVKRAENGSGSFRSLTTICDNERRAYATLLILPFSTPSSILSLFTSFSLIFTLCVLSPPSTLFPLTRPPSLPDSLPSRGGTQKSNMFTFNFTFHVPNPFSMSSLTSVANAATDAFNSVATDIREDPELLNYMMAGAGPGGVAGGFGYDSNRLVKPPPASFMSSSSPTSPKSKPLKGPQNRHAVGLSFANAHAPNRKRHLPGHERNHANLQGSTPGFLGANTLPGSGTPRFPTQAYSQSSSYSLGVHGLRQGVRNDQLHHPLPASRKRGWVPALSEPSYVSTNEDFMTGLFDTPEHRNVDDMRDGASRPGSCHDSRRSSGVGDRRKWDEGDETESENAMEAELPPAKRRKGLAGSIVSTALSAALIGTAVGLTMYRLWKERGRVDSAPPPPYEESQRSHQQTHDPKAHLHGEQTQTNGRSPRRRHAATSGRRAAGNGVRQRKPIPQRFHPTAYSQQPVPSQPVQAQDLPSGPFDFKFGQAEEEGEGEPDDQMDWIGDRISQLIEEGKKALGKEVVVMSDSKEDEVDDGSGLWEDSGEEEFGSPTSPRNGRRSLSSPRRKRARPSLSHQIIPGNLGEFSPSRPSACASPTTSTFPASPSSIRPLGEPFSPSPSTTSWMRETEGDWESEEVKASMERARAIYMAKRREQAAG